jgi:hypothetical protein
MFVPFHCFMPSPSFTYTTTVTPRTAYHDGSDMRTYSLQGAHVQLSRCSSSMPRRGRSGAADHVWPVGIPLSMSTAWLLLLWGCERNSQTARQSPAWPGVVRMEATGAAACVYAHAGRCIRHPCTQQPCAYACAERCWHVQPQSSKQHLLLLVSLQDSLMHRQT